MTANVVVNAPDTTLDEAPESFDGIRVNLANYVNAFAVINSSMLVSASIKPVIRAEGVGEYNRLREDVLFNQPVQRIGLNIGSDKCSDLPLALNHADNRGFLGSTSACSF